MSLKEFKHFKLTENSFPKLARLLKEEAAGELDLQLDWKKKADAFWKDKVLPKNCVGYTYWGGLAKKEYEPVKNMIKVL